MIGKEGADRGVRVSPFFLSFIQLIFMESNICIEGSKSEAKFQTSL